MSRHLTCLALACLLAMGISPVGAEEAKRVPLAEAFKRVQVHRDTIEAGRKLLEAQFIDHEEDVIRAALRKHGVGDEAIPELMKKWLGDVVFFSWPSNAKQNFYETNERNLADFRQVIQGAGYADAEDLDYYDERMAEWSKAEPLMREHVATVIDTMARFYSLVDKRRTLIEAGVTTGFDLLADETDAARLQLNLAIARAWNCAFLQYLTVVRNAGDKRLERERIEAASTKGEILLPGHLAERRLVALMLTMNLATIEISALASRTNAGWRRGHFRKESDTTWERSDRISIPVVQPVDGPFRDWCERRGHAYNDSACLFEDLPQDRKQKDFHVWHHDALMDSLLSMRAEGVARLKDVTYLEKGMKAWEPKAAKLKATYLKIGPQLDEIEVHERVICPLGHHFADLCWALDPKASEYEEKVLVPAMLKAEKAETRINKSIDLKYDTIFEITYQTRLFHAAPAGEDDGDAGESEGATETDGP